MDHVDSALDLHLSLLLREGAIFYLNGIEIARFNMGYNSRDWAAASHVFPFSRLLTVEVSSSFLHKGTNLLAVEVHRHAFSDSYVEFSVSTFLIGAEMKRQIRQFPVIRASTDV